MRKYFKRSKSLLIKRFDNLTDEEKQQVNVILYYSVNISRAYWYKEEFLKIIYHKDSESAIIALNEWIENAECCGIPQFEKCAKTMRNWYKGIANSLSLSITNGFCVLGKDAYLFVSDTPRLYHLTVLSATSSIIAI